MINFETHYRKGFHGDQELWTQFRDCIGHNIDCHKLENVIVARREKLGVDVADVFAVDPDIHAVKSNDLELMTSVRTPQPGDAEFDAELDFLFDLASKRDIPLAQLPSTLPLKYRQPSYFLRHVTQQSYATADYMVQEAAYVAVQEGKKPIEAQQMGPTRSIQTGRDMARFVHDDNPVAIFQSVVAQLVQSKVETRVGPSMVRNSACGRFAGFGVPFFIGAIGEVGRRVGLVSFREKWNLWIPRPEQYAFDTRGVFLPQVFAEGSPYHPSRNAMHQIIYAACGGYVLEMFNPLAKLPNGNTVEFEIELLIGNGGCWREWAGVHYPSDNEPYIERAKKLGQKVAKENLGLG